MSIDLHIDDRLSVFEVNRTIILEPIQDIILFLLRSLS